MERAESLEDLDLKDAVQLDSFLKNRRRDFPEIFVVKTAALNDEIRAVLEKHKILF
jgi:hypothetical protein